MATRLAVSDGIRETTLGQGSYIQISIQKWNRIPKDVRSAPTLCKFKSKLKNWVKMNLLKEINSKASALWPALGTIK